MAKAEKTATRFSDVQYEYAYPDGSEHHYWTLARIRILQRQLALLGNAEQVGGILDIGCGRGLMVSCLRHWGYDAWGCDLGEGRPFSEEVQPYLTLGTEALELPASRRAQTKLILLLDVLEHLQEPALFLSKCAERFPNCQFLLATLPARQELWSNYDEHYGHGRRYNRKTAQELVIGNEFALVRAGYFFHLLYFAARAMRLAGWKRSVTTRPPSPKMRCLHRLLAAILYWEYRLAPAWVPGTSLLLLMKRRQN